jgi:hypothetical protein
LEDKGRRREGGCCGRHKLTLFCSLTLTLCLSLFGIWSYVFISRKTLQFC